MIETITSNEADLRYHRALAVFGGRNRDEIDNDMNWHSPPEWQAAYRTIQELEWLMEDEQEGRAG